MTATWRPLLVGVLGLAPWAHAAPPGAAWVEREPLYGYGSVAVSGDTVLLSRGQDVSVYRFIDGAWLLNPSQPTLDRGETSDIGFGNPIVMDGDTALVGAARAAPRAVYVYAQVNGAWTLQQKLVPPEAPATEQFGGNFAVSGDTALIHSALDGAHAVYVFTRTAGVWSMTQRLAPTDAADSDVFGAVLALDGDTAFVADPGFANSRGQVHVFAWDGATWAEQAPLGAPNGIGGDMFGQTVAISGDLVLIGAPDSRQGDQGAVYVFGREAGVWTQRQLLTASVLSNTDNLHFGGALAFSGDQALVGAPFVDTLSRDNGLVYVWQLENGVFAEQQTLTGSGVERAHFGGVIAMDGTRALLPDADGRIRVFGYGTTTGGACTAQSECATGLCADARCCDEVCSGPCDVCSVTRGAAQDGYCTPLPDGNPGEPACALACDGVGGDCPVGRCEGNAVRDETGALTECFPHRCMQGACYVPTTCRDSTECAEGAACNQVGKCSKAQPVSNSELATAGCGCRSAAEHGTAPGRLAVVLALVALGLQRRRRRARALPHGRS